MISPADKYCCKKVNLIKKKVQDGCFCKLILMKIVINVERFVESLICNFGITILSK